jgi:DNA-binding transcriptional MerR regulator
MNIREFAKHTGLTAHTLRYYERVGLMGDVARGNNGHRVYGPQDAQWVEFLHRLRESGMSIREIQRFCQLCEQGEGSLGPRIELLQRHVDALAAELRAKHDHLARLRERIAVYRAQQSGKLPMRQG